MKKLLAILLVIVMFFNLVACGGNSSSDSGAESENKENQQVEVDEKLLTVDITLPASLLESFGVTAEDYTQSLEGDEQYKNVKVNDDGSITITMSKSDHKKLLKEMKEQIEASFPNENFYSVKELKVNNDVTECTLIVNQAEYESGLQGLAAWQIALTTTIYHTFEGKPERKTVLHIVDEETNTEFETRTFPDDLAK